MDRRKIYILASFCLTILIFNNCINRQKKNTDFRGEGYIGSEKCSTCHKEIYDSYVKTAHYLSSSPASKDAIKGSFSKDSNELYYRPALKVVMEKTDSGFYQVAYVNNIEKQAARFDIVIGSGRKGQSYLYWFDDNVFQLPVSYYVPGKSWVNSPTYPLEKVLFNRNIPVGCFECHSAYIKKTATKPSADGMIDYFDKSKIIYGIDCERCHGPAEAHVNFHENNPNEKKSTFIANAATLARQEKLDMCAMCHSGARETISSTFYFNPGSKLSKYLRPDTSTVRTSQIDVHGKQYQLLTASKCFIKSKTMTCSSCHNTHAEERNNLRDFSMRCMNCHNNPVHDPAKMIGVDRAGIVNNCIDCHMPARPSAVITMKSQSQAEPIPALVRTHYISVYADETIKFILKQK
ncbi:MAG: multiheme c-type cytochrome [Ferruginibacter sp.]